MTDQYHISEKTIREPPETLGGKLKLLGPGFILSASIVGSGELIATTTLGAKAGFAAFWVIIVSCFAKVAVQLEFGKHTIATGETAMKALGKLPGPKLGKTGWAVWLWFFLILLKIVQLGGILGSTALVLSLLFPGYPIWLWVILSSVITGILISGGYYNIVEKFSLFMMAMFTILTVTAVYALNYTQFDFTLAEVFRGTSFNLSGGIMAVAIGAFGITGVASDEIIAYNYWCIEKGYAAYAGPRQDDQAWRIRARKWMRIMYLDAIVAMIIYTTVTAAFYLLGAAVLHRQGIFPEGNQVIETVALVYTQSLGNGIRIVYLIGAFFVLYSSLFASNAAWTRMYSDIFAQLGTYDFYDGSKRKRLITILAWVFPTVWAIIYLFIELPVIMILSGGFVGSVMLLLIIFAALNFRYKRVQIYKPSILYDVAFWTSVVSILFVAIYGLSRFF